MKYLFFYITNMIYTMLGQIIAASFIMKIIDFDIKGSSWLFFLIYYLIANFCGVTQIISCALTICGFIYFAAITPYILLLLPVWFYPIYARIRCNSDFLGQYDLGNGYFLYYNIAAKDFRVAKSKSEKDYEI